MLSLHQCFHPFAKQDGIGLRFTLRKNAAWGNDTKIRLMTIFFPRKRTLGMWDTFYYLGVDLHWVQLYTWHLFCRWSLSNYTHLRRCQTLRFRSPKKVSFLDILTAISHHRFLQNTFPKFPRGILVVIRHSLSESFIMNAALIFHHHFDQKKSPFLKHFLKLQFFFCLHKDKMCTFHASAKPRARSRYKK